MSAAEVTALCREYKELQRLQEDLSAELEAVRERIREAMQGADVMSTGEYKITDRLVTSSRLDSGALKKALPEVAAQFTKTTQARRFIIT